MDKTKTGVWITGASSGIGKAAAIEFAKVGCKVFVSARRAAQLNILADDIDESQFEVYPCNVGSKTNVNQTVKKITAGNNIDCLVNNAGITTFKPAEENTIKEIEDVINTNLLGSIYTIKAVLPYMIKNNGGTIINVLSVVANKIFENSSAYTASKMGLLGYTNVLREEVRKYNIRVINIFPGATETAMWPKDAREKYSKRMMSPEGIARIMVSSFLHTDNLVTEEIVLRPVEGDI